MQGQQVVGLTLFSMWKTRESNTENVEVYRDSLLSLQNDMVICLMNVARQRFIKLTGVNRETKMINVYLQVTAHFRVLNGMPTARELPFVTILT